MNHPLRKLSASASPPMAPEMAPEPQVNVLLVDDRLENLVVLERVLQGLGQNLVKVQSGTAALKYLLHHDVAVILLDVQMPGLDGFETARLIRQRDRSQHTPIIFLTAFAESEDLRSQGYTLGAVDYLYKPIEPVVLTSKVAVFIDLFKKNLEVQRQASQLIAQNAAIIRAEAARQQAEEANRLKDEFLAIVSHELRTPLNSILGWSQLLLKREFDPATMRRALETIEGNAQTQVRLIQDILDISRLMRGKVDLSIRSIELVPFIQEAIESIRPQASAKSIHLDVQLCPTSGTIQADSVRLHQIIWNLLTNAIKFTPEGGTVSLRIAPAVNGWLKLQISDTGIGIEPEVLPHVFDHFWQADSSSTRLHGGLGLGLAIVRQLVELHQGTIEVQSDGCQQGTTFTMYLPHVDWRQENSPKPISEPISEPLLDQNRQAGTRCSAVGRTKQHAKKAEPQKLSLQQLQILVVEDHPDNRDFVQKILEDAGALVITAGCTQDALSILEQTQPDVIVSDIAMPGEDGYQFIQRVRVLQPKPIPAIAVTAYARSEDRTQALKAGFQTYLSKPIDAEELVNVIIQLMD